MPTKSNQNNFVRFRQTLLSYEHEFGEEFWIISYLSNGGLDGRHEGRSWDGKCTLFQRNTFFWKLYIK